MFTFSKKQLTMGLMMILLSLACCVHGSKVTAFKRKVSDEKVDAEHPASMDDNEEPKLQSHPKFTGDAWDRFFQYIGIKNGRKKRLGWSLLLLGLFVVGICAIAAPGCTPEQHGMHIFDDVGASLWLRFSVMSLCLTFSLGMLGIAIHRARNSEDKTQEEYDNWKKTGSCTGCNPEGKWNDFSRNSSRKLLFIFSVFSMLLFVSVLAGGAAAGNCDDIMFHYTLMIPLLVGGVGFAYLCVKGRIEAATKSHEPYDEDTKPTTNVRELLPDEEKQRFDLVENDDGVGSQESPASVKPDYESEEMDEENEEKENQSEEVRNSCCFGWSERGPRTKTDPSRRVGNTGDVPEDIRRRLKDIINCINHELIE